NLSPFSAKKPDDAIDALGLEYKDVDSFSFVVCDRSRGCVGRERLADISGQDDTSGRRFGRIVGLIDAEYLVRRSNVALHELFDSSGVPKIPLEPDNQESRRKAYAACEQREREGSSSNAFPNRRPVERACEGSGHRDEAHPGIITSVSSDESHCAGKGDTEG